MPHPCYHLLLGVMFLSLARFVSADDGVPPTNPFYAMDTAFQRGGLTTEQQLDLVKELGFDGIAWTETTPESAAAVAASAEKRGLKMHAMYCQARVTPDGQLTHGPQLEKLMTALKGRGTIIWLHIGGKGPAFDSLTGKEPLVGALRGLADVAAKNELRVAIYPHVGEWTARFGDATALAKLVDHPRFGVTFNLCHCLATGDEENIPKLLIEAKSVLTTVTINGADKGVKGGQWDRLIQTLGKGTYDPEIVMCTLRQIKFAGPVGFQGYGIAGDARSILTPTINAWRTLSRHNTEENKRDGRKQPPTQQERIDKARVDLKNTRAEIRRAAILALVHSDLSETLRDDIQEALKDKDAEVRATAATATGNLGAAAASAVPLLIAQLLDDPSKEARETAARALGRIGKAAKDERHAVPQLRTSAAKDADPVTRVVALGALAMLDVDVAQQVAALRRFLHAESPLVRMKAAHGLGMIGSAAKAAAPEIVTVLERAADAHHRGYIARALGNTGDPASLPALYKAIGDETDPAARGEMQGAIVRLGGKAPPKYAPGLLLLRTPGHSAALPFRPQVQTRSATPWSVKEVVGHLIDGERIFGCRALRFRAVMPHRCPASTRMPRRGQRHRIGVGWAISWRSSRRCGDRTCGCCAHLAILRCRLAR